MSGRGPWLTACVDGTREPLFTGQWAAVSIRSAEGPIRTRTVCTGVDAVPVLTSTGRGAVVAHAVGTLLIRRTFRRGRPCVDTARSAAPGHQAVLEGLRRFTIDIGSARFVGTAISGGGRLVARTFVDPGGSCRSPGGSCRSPGGSCRSVCGAGVLSSLSCAPCVRVGARAAAVGIGFRDPTTGGAGESQKKEGERCKGGLHAYSPVSGGPV